MTQQTDHLTLDGFLEDAKSLSRNSFLARYGDPLLVAMGVLDIEDIRSRCGATTEMHVAKPATHNPQKPHPLAGKVFPVPLSSSAHGSLVFGRQPPADIVVPDETVSQMHCIVSWDNLETTITDQNSTNGTLVNLKSLVPNRPVELLNEDIITIGMHSFQYYLPGHFFRVLQALLASKPVP